MITIHKSVILAASLAFLGAIGCGSRSPEGGVAGTTDSFHLTGPAPVSLKAGDKQTVNVTVSRDANFKQEVTLAPESPKGIKAEFAKEVTLSAENKDKIKDQVSNAITGKHTVKQTDGKEVPLSISADTGTAAGDYIVKVVGTPQTGAATSVDVKVTVTAK